MKEYHEKFNDKFDVRLSKQRYTKTVFAVLNKIQFKQKPIFQKQRYALA